MRSDQELPSNLDGYYAAGLIIAEQMRMAKPKAAKRMKPRPGRQYWLGYYQGLLFAHCQHALGEFPAVNADLIRAAVQSASTED